MYNNWDMANQAFPVQAKSTLDQSTSAPKLSGWTLRALRAGWLLLAVVGLAIILTSLPGYSGRLAGELFHVPSDQAGSGSPLGVASGIASLASTALSFSLAVLLFRRRFEEPAAAVLSFYLVIYSVVLAGPWEHWETVWLEGESLAFVVQSVFISTPTLALFAVFPNGRIYPSWMRWIVLTSIPWSIAVPILAPTPNNLDAFGFSVLGIGFIVLFGLSVYGQILRYRKRSTPVEQQQTKWVLFGFSLWVLYMLLSSIPYFHLISLPEGAPAPWWAGLSEFGWWLSLSIIPVSLTVAITRYRLWNIDIVINRSIVFAGLAIGLTAIYMLIIAVLGLLFQSSDSLIIPLSATGAAILVFQPLRARLQAAVNRMMYGDRDAPGMVLARLGEQLAGTSTHQDTLTGIVDTVAAALKLPYVAIELSQPGNIVARFGEPSDTVQAFPLVNQGAIIGQLLVSPRAHDEALSQKDRDLLEKVAHQAGVAAYNANLTADLLRARHRLVSAREEERRRIRRDLHDGLGPQLASLSLKLDAAKNLLDDKPKQSTQLLDESKHQLKDAVADIRRLVYNLRPPALDELGLMSALREQAATHPADLGLRVHIDGPDQLPKLPAAVEVAAYRIVQEAIKNASQHAGASVCQVSIKMEDQLEIHVHDDGIGLQEDWKPGVGLVSMRERAEELGGEFSIAESPEGGVHLHVSLPLLNEGDN
ncbi:MAG: histidine kinase [Anaerolineales bacterium]